MTPVMPAMVVMPAVMPTMGGGRTGGREGGNTDDGGGTEVSSGTSYSAAELPTATVPLPLRRVSTDAE
ncbi:MAG: hypothetical protein P8Z80_04455 [Pseudolabrys sp.]